MNEWSDSAPLLVASLLDTRTLVECEANLVSDFDYGFS
jgi:hypothetical protein